MLAVEEILEESMVWFVPDRKVQSHSCSLAASVGQVELVLLLALLFLMLLMMLTMMLLLVVVVYMDGPHQQGSPLALSIINLKYWNAWNPLYSFQHGASQRHHLQSW
jgi:hypothetical protein